MEKIRYPAVAGQFYPEEKENLERQIEDFLNRAKIEKIEGEIVGGIVPHAGYIFSGFVASHFYKAIEKEKFETAILIGDSHYERFEGISVFKSGKWITPLGEVLVDENLAKELLDFSPRFFERDSAHLFEHSLEVQIPFLQKVLKNFKILPIIFGSEDKDWKDLARAILKLREKKKVILVISSDLSHYPPYEIAKELDKKTVKEILKLDPEKFSKKADELEEKYKVDCVACAKDSIKTILEISKILKLKAKLLKYQNSGDTVFGDKERVVGYCSILFFNFS